ncbi:MAG: MFS transporter [Oligoflexales bacterium]
MSTQQSYRTRLFVISSALGTYLEFLDYTLFAYASKIIAFKLLPPSEHALIYTWLIFAASFFFRVLGTVVFGALGDRKGGKIALLWSMLLMAASTTAIGFIPDYSEVSWLAPCLLLFFRSLQSFAVSPEYSGAATYLSKLDLLKDRYSFTTSITVAVAGFGMLSGGFWMSAMVEGFALESIPSWRWRLPFVLSGIVVGFAATLIRISMVDDKGKGEFPAEGMFEPIRLLWRRQAHEILCCIGMVGLVGLMTYTLSGYFANYLHQERSYELGRALALTSKHTLVLCIAILFSGYLADRWAPTAILRGTAGLIMILSWPIFYLINHGSQFEVSFGIMLFSVLLGFFSGPLPGVLARTFAQVYRYTGSSIAYNVGMSIFGGFTPVLMLGLGRLSPFAPGALISAYAAFVMLFLVVQVPESYVVESLS